MAADGGSVNKKLLLLLPVPIPEIDAVIAQIVGQIVVHRVVADAVVVVDTDLVDTDVVDADLVDSALVDADRLATRVFAAARYAGPPASHT